MRIWTVHLPPHAGESAGSPRPIPRLLPERFSWGAVVFGPLWLLARGLWVSAILWCAVAVAAVALLPPALVPPALGTLQLLLGFSAHDLRRAALQQRGWTLLQVVAAPDEDAALLRLIDAHPHLLAPPPADPADAPDATDATDATIAPATPLAA